MRPAWLCAVGAAAITLGAAPTQAEPSIWQRAADPAVHRDAQLLSTAEILLGEYIYLRRAPDSFRRSQILQKARRTMEREGAPDSEDVQVRYHLAEIYYRLSDVERDDGRLDDAIAHLEWVAASAGPVTLRAQALHSLAICYARLERHEDEIAANQRALTIEPDVETFSLLLANQAEGYMARGDVRMAVLGYRASLASTPSYLMAERGVTTLWGLAVALDRSGDLDGALEQIALARALDPNDEQLGKPSWFFVPEYDEDWYHALGHWQLGRTLDDRDDRVHAFRAAVASLRSFVERADADDPWLPLGARRLAQCEKELTRAIQRADEARRANPREGAEAVDRSVWE